MHVHNQGRSSSRLRSVVHRIHLALIAFALSCVFPFSALARMSYKTSAEAKTDMSAFQAQKGTADRCVTETQNKRDVLAKEFGKLTTENTELQKNYDALAAERDTALQELAQGMFCSRCNRSASEIERSGTSFYAHLDDVNGTPIPAAPEVIEQKRQEYEQKLQQIKNKQQQNASRLDQIAQDWKKELQTQQKCQANADVALEGFTRAKHWFLVLSKLEAENKLAERLLPKPLEANKFGLGKNMRSSEYFVQRAYLKNGTVVTLEPGVTVDPLQIVRIATHRGVDFTSREDTTPKPLPFNAGVTGTAWAVPGSNYNTINVKDSQTGNVVQFLHASEVAKRFDTCSEANPCSVWPGTRLGTTGQTGAEAIHLHVQVKDKDGNYVDPDMAFLPKNSPFYSIEQDVQNEIKALKTTKP